MSARGFRRVRRAGPEIVLGLVVVLSGVSLWQAWQVSDHLRTEAREVSRVFGHIIAGLSDTTAGAEADVLLRLARDIAATGLPLIVTDAGGMPTAAVNLPFDAPVHDSRVREYARELERTNPPIPIEGLGHVHFGKLPGSGRITGLAVFQLALLLTVIAVGLWAYRTAVHRDRDRLWVAMARESAHQLGTPLMSAGAWIERLAEGQSPPAEVAEHLRADLDRLERVVKRFERIGRPARRDDVALGALVERVASYFRPRLPQRANIITLTVSAPGAGPMVTGDPVLLEWAVEALVRNSVDALSGRGGRITITVAPGDDRASVSVSDDGPGIPPEIRATVFEPGVTTKTGGWGIGLALTRRIVEDVHEGRLRLSDVVEGAEFVIDLPAG